MFFRLYKYGLLTTVRQKVLMFWNVLFPVVLGTLFRATFGGYMENMEFQEIPVAYVEEEGADESFRELLKTLEEDSSLVKVQTVDSEEAKKLLEEESVEGIFYNTGNDGVMLSVSEQDINQSILSSILEQYERTFSTVTNIGEENPQKIGAALTVLEEEVQYIKEENITDKPQNNMMDAFYSLIAMNCLMGAMAGVTCAGEYKADLSDLAARRVVASTSRFGILLAELSSKITIQFLCSAFSVCFLTYVLNISLGSNMGLIMLTAFLGSALGIILGFFIGVAGRFRMTAKEAISLIVMLGSSFLSGLMVQEMYWFVEKYAPLIHRINPASLIVNAMRSLEIYGTYETYMQCMASLSALTILLGAGIFAVVRRERYASV